MGKRIRHKTDYPGVIYFEHPKGKVYYAVYRKKGKGSVIEEKVGNSWQGWTPAKANIERGKRIDGKVLSNQEQREAEKAAKEAEAGRYTISKLWDLYRENLEGLKSQAADQSRFTNYLNPALGHKEPQEIIPLDIDRLERKTLDGKSEQTKKHVLALLRRIVRYGVKKQVALPLSFNLEMPEVDNEIIETLTNDQLKNLLKALNESDDIQISGIMKMALFTGMRKGELLKLKWVDVDLERGFLQIKAPKGGRSMSIPLNESAKGILQNHPHVSEHVFVNHKGKAFHEIRKRVEQIRKAAQLPAGFRPLHGLRHVYASMLASSGQVDIYTLQRLLTHKSTTTTQRYAHIMDEALKKASGVMVDLLKAADEGGENG